jgi:hypothetical protein
LGLFSDLSSLPCCGHFVLGSPSSGGPLIWSIIVPILKNSKTGGSIRGAKFRREGIFFQPNIRRRSPQSRLSVALQQIPRARGSRNSWFKSLRVDADTPDSRKRREIKDPYRA